MSRRKVYLVCNAHLDPVWLWEWQEGVAAAVSTFRTAADLCEEFDEFIFNHNEAILYQWVEEYEPALMERIKKLVKAGKWHIMGGWHLQPDCNMPSGESFVRQILTGRTYFKKTFGKEPTTAINFDPFGHSRGLVQILAKSGYDSYLFCRPAESDCHLPDDQFVWVGFDGSEVMGTRMPFYNSLLGKAREKVNDILGKAGKDDDCIIIPWGVGNHGGGPSRQDLRDLRELINTTKDFEVTHSTPEQYFSHLAGKSLPKHEQDINPWAVGCYTSQVRIKQKHRLLENELYSLEKMASAAAMQGLMDYPNEELASALYDLCTSEFHDILPGSSIQPVEDMSLRILDHGLETVSRAKARAFFALASGEEKARENEIPILVYNPHPFKVKTVLECEFQLADQNWEDSFTITPVYHKGKLIPSQNEKEDSNLTLDWRKRVAFMAELEPSCMNRFDCRLQLLPARPRPSADTSGDAITFKTDEIEVIVNKKTGLVDKYSVNGTDVVGPNAFEPVVMLDNEDPWGMTTRSFKNEEGRFKLMSPEKGTKFSGVTQEVIPSVRVIEDGPARTVVEAVFEYGNSAVCQQYKLPKIGTEIEIFTRVHWEEKNRLLKLSVPMVNKAVEYLGQTAYGVQSLPMNGDEAVAQKWTSVVFDNGRALTCINDGVYGSDCSDNGMSITLMRSPSYSGHPIGERPVVPQDRYTPRIDQGERLFRFWFNAGDSAGRLEQIDREALIKNEKPYVLSFFPSGAGRKPEQFAVLSDDVLQMTAAKLSEDGKALIIRLFEPTGKARQTTLSLPFCGIEKSLSFSEFEIKTLRIDMDKQSITETNLMEQASSS